MRARRRPRHQPLPVPARPVLALPVLTLVLALSAGCVITAEAGPPPDAWHERTLERSVRVPDGETLRLENLAGQVVVRPTDGAEVTIRADVRAGGDDEVAARELAEAIEFVSGERDGSPVLTLSYPVDRHTDFHYDRGEDDAPGFLSWFGGSNTQLRYQGRRVRVSTGRRSGAATVSADLEVGVPRGTRLRVLNAVGRARADGVVGDLALEVHSGSIVSRDGEGALSLDTGSGSVGVTGHRGDVAADTGSGGVEISGVRGEVRADTGSGSVSVSDVEGPFVGVDTGSGGVTLAAVRAALDVDTGSGSVRGEELVLAERVRVDTGSGSVRLSGDFAAVRAIEIDTGSGSVRLAMDAWPAMRLDLRSGSGGVSVDLPDVRVTRSGRNSLVAEVGEGERVDVVVSTGSGGITVTRQD